MKKSFAQLLSLEKDKFQKKVDTKLPAWKGANIVIPFSLALEQCSSSQTAEYKALLAISLRPQACAVGGNSSDNGMTICDITGGLGADSFAFAKHASKVHYFERNPELVEAAKANAKNLNISNIEFHLEEINQDSELPNCELIYADPARRSESGKKVFLLEDCSPDILKLLPLLCEKSRFIMLKLSPMADITMVANRLGSQLEEIHIVSLDGEVKELLCLLDKEHCGNFQIIVAELFTNKENDFFSFVSLEESEAKLDIADSISEGQILLEPSAAIMKASCYKLLSKHFGIKKLDPNTHLYISDNPIDTKLLKQFKILKTYSFKQIKEIQKLYPKAEVSAKNIHLKSEELRSKLGIKSGSDSIHIFGTKTPSGTILIVAERINRANF